MKRVSLVCCLALGAAFPPPCFGQAEMHSRMAAVAHPESLPPLPNSLPNWLYGRKKNHIFYKRGPYNFDLYNIDRLARDMNAVAVGHAMAYEALVTGKADSLETQIFERIHWVLEHPPRLMPDEASISPTFGRTYGVLEEVFDWTHILHAQTMDVLASTDLSDSEKDQEIEALWRYYTESVPYAITPLPMSMVFLDGQPYSMAFRDKYPKVNGLFWGYHWLQGAVYDGLYVKSLRQQKMVYDVLGDRYHATELYRTDRPFMPMFAEVSPRFSLKFPHIANAFDNLHMLHDMVNDILASDWIPTAEKERQILRAIWLVSAEAHRGEEPGQSRGDDGMHDHRHMLGMPAMGMMKFATEEIMYMDKMGWMSMADCHHCSMPLPEGADAWKAPTVSAEGWTMRARCPLCARDMAAETRGRAIFHIPTEDAFKPLVVISDDQGNLTTDRPDAVFLEQEGGHETCQKWSSAFSSRAAFDAHVAARPEFKNARPVPFQEWADLRGKKPNTYVKPEGPEGNPYDKHDEDTDEDEVDE